LHAAPVAVAIASKLLARPPATIRWIWRPLHSTTTPIKRASVCLTECNLARDAACSGRIDRGVSDRCALRI